MEEESVTHERSSQFVEIVGSVARYQESLLDPKGYFERYKEDIRSGLNRLSTPGGTTKKCVLITAHSRIRSFPWTLHQLSKQYGNDTSVEVFLNGNPSKEAQIDLNDFESICQSLPVRYTRHPEALGVSGGRAYAISNLDHDLSEVLITLDEDTGPLTSRWIEVIQSKFSENSRLGALYLPHFFPTAKGLVHKAITLPAQLTRNLLLHRTHATGPAAAFRTVALSDLTSPDTELSIADYEGFNETKLLQIVSHSGYSAENIFIPASWNLTDGGRFPWQYTFIVAGQRIGISPIADLANDAYKNLYRK